MVQRASTRVDSHIQTPRVAAGRRAVNNASDTYPRAEGGEHGSLGSRSARAAWLLEPRAIAHRRRAAMLAGVGGDSFGRNLSSPWVSCRRGASGSVARAQEPRRAR